jgi:hypothetical protein
MFETRPRGSRARPETTLQEHDRLSRGLRWDAVLVSALARELDERLAGARLRALYLDPGGRSVLLFLREGTLAVSFRPE